MTALLDERLRVLAAQTHTLEEKVSSLGWMAGADAKTLKSMTRAQAHLMLAECNLLDAIEANEKAESHVYPDKGYVTAVRERTNYGAVWALSSRGALDQACSRSGRTSNGWTKGWTLDFTPACSFQLLESQLYAMGTYANILQERARIEQVDLNAPLEGGESDAFSQD